MVPSSQLEVEDDIGVLLVFDRVEGTTVDSVEEDGTIVDTSVVDDG